MINEFRKVINSGWYKSIVVEDVINTFLQHVTSAKLKYVISDKTQKQMADTSD